MYDGVPTTVPADDEDVPVEETLDPSAHRFPVTDPRYREPHLVAARDLHPIPPHQRLDGNRRRRMRNFVGLKPQRSHSQCAAAIVGSARLTRTR